MEKQRRIEMEKKRGIEMEIEGSGFFLNIQMFCWLWQAEFNLFPTYSSPLLFLLATGMEWNISNYVFSLQNFTLFYDFSVFPTKILPYFMFKKFKNCFNLVFFNDICLPPFTGMNKLRKNFNLFFTSGISDNLGSFSNFSNSCSVIHAQSSFLNFTL